MPEGKQSPNILSLPFVEELYAQYLRDPSAVPQEWRGWFEGGSAEPNGFASDPRSSRRSRDAASSAACRIGTARAKRAVHLRGAGAELCRPGCDNVGAAATSGFPDRRDSGRRQTVFPRALPVARRLRAVRRSAPAIR